MWQPIETAPKDGRMLLVYSDHFGTGYFGCVRWEVFRDRSGGWVGASFLSMPAGSWTAFMFPTHWQPLPDPPAPSPEAQE